MKKLLWILICIGKLAFCQTNLVPNWSFEEYNSCPNANTTDCSISPPTIPALKDWFCALTYESTPDYFNACGITSLSTPTNIIGYQIPKTGYSYVGSITHTMYSSSINNNSEYIECKLKDSLKPNVIYCVNYFVSRADKRDYASSNFGALFTNTVINIPGLPHYINQVPQVQNPFGNFIFDKLNWTKIQGSFIANGGENYLTLGSFGANSNIDTLYDPDIPIDPNKRYLFPYYYIDDVSVEEVVNAQAGLDKVIISGNSTVIGGDSAVGADYLWLPSVGLDNNTLAFPIASPTITTQYVLQKTQCSVITYDTMLVTVNSVGIEELTINNAFATHPNPATNDVTITSSFDMQKIELLDVAGKLVTSENRTTKNKELQLQNFAEGIYFIKVTFINGVSVTKKMLVIR
jgi:hypothetical protein